MENIVIYKKVIFYTVALSLGVLAGWQLRDLTISQRTPNIDAASNADNPLKQTPEILGETPSSETNLGVTTVDQPQAEQVVNNQTLNKQALTISTFLEKLIQLSDNELQQLFNTEEVSEVFSESPELFDSLLEQLLNMDNQKLANRVSRVLSWHLMNNHKLQEKTENHIFEKIKSYDRAPEWLEVLKTWGVHQPSNLLYLADQLPLYTDTTQASNALGAIASSFAPFNKALNADELSRLNYSMEPFLSASDETMRASAVRSLTFLTYPDRDNRVLNALRDKSSKVRINAMMVTANQHIKSEEVKSLIINAIKDKNRGAIERLEAYHMHSIFALSQSDYAVVYEFGAKEAAALQEEYLNRLSTLRNTEE